MTLTTNEPSQPTEAEDTTEVQEPWKDPRSPEQIVESRRRRLQFMIVPLIAGLLVAWMATKQAWWVNTVPGMTIGGTNVNGVSFTEAGDQFAAPGRIFQVLTISALAGVVGIKARLFLVPVLGLFGVIAAHGLLALHLAERQSMHSAGRDFLSVGPGPGQMSTAFLIVGAALLSTAVSAWMVATAEIEVLRARDPEHAPGGMIALLFPQMAVTRAMGRRVAKTGEPAAAKATA